MVKAGHHREVQGKGRGVAVWEGGRRRDVGGTCHWVLVFLRQVWIKFEENKRCNGDLRCLQRVPNLTHRQCLSGVWFRSVLPSESNSPEPRLGEEASMEWF